jgi:hypothetical protein
MIMNTTKTNAPALIAEDHHDEIAPNPRRAARTALTIPTETKHRSMMTRRDTKKTGTKRLKHAPNRTTEKDQKITSNLIKFKQ